ncbi:MAG: hypothetical protein IPG96_20405 [Proteobacteria bacterium]|nr:hypothetical protein [Pseudomonadota bacterium]
MTTDHISPAGSIGKSTPAGSYPLQHGVAHQDFNSYGARRGNDRVMTRGTFANIRLRNQLRPGTEGGFPTHFPSGEVLTISRRPSATATPGCRRSWSRARLRYGAAAATRRLRAPSLSRVRAADCALLRRGFIAPTVGMACCRLELPAMTPRSPSG